MQQARADETLVDNRTNGKSWSIADAHGLTLAERQVLDRLLSGKAEVDIALELQIREATIRKRCLTLMRKLNTNNRAGLVERARQWDLAVSRLLR